MPRPLYVETRIRTSREQLWRRTQEPGQHQRWDLRFSAIEYAPLEAGRPQAFTYGFRLPWRMVTGTGVAAGESERSDGQLTSALRYTSHDRLSPLLAGHGWWRYVPEADGFRFLTGYDYTVRWGAAGRLVDRVAFRPWMGWATAWSFDRLRLWCEQGIEPERSRNVALMDAASRLTIVAAAASRGRRRRLPFAVAVACLVPRPAAVPRARRCLRAPYDALGRRAPSLTATLEPS